MQKMLLLYTVLLTCSLIMLNVVTVSYHHTVRLELTHFLLWFLLFAAFLHLYFYVKYIWTNSTAPWKQSWCTNYIHLSSDCIFTTFLVQQCFHSARYLPPLPDFTDVLFPSWEGNTENLSIAMSFL